MSAFMRGQEVRREEFEWGAIGWRCTPAVVGAKQLVVMDVEIRPGAGHDFHRHPVQEEVIIVTAGEIEQWVGGRSVHPAPGRLGVHSRGPSPCLVQPQSRDGALESGHCSRGGDGFGVRAGGRVQAATVGLASLTW